MEISARNNQYKPFYALIVAGGTGTRMKDRYELPKQYLKLEDKTILRHTVEKYLSCKSIKSVRVVINANHEDLYQAAVAGLDLPRPAYAGESRKESVYNGLYNFPDIRNEDIILIHDAARPFVRAHDIDNVVHAVSENRAATLATPVSDTLKRETGAYVDREGLWTIQTPQGFEYGLILKAHEQAKAGKVYTDDTGIVADLGVEAALVPGSRDNFKITTPEDYELACALMAGLALKENLAA